MIKRVAILLLCCLTFVLAPSRALGEDDDWNDIGDNYYTVKLESGEALFTVGAAVYVDDQYISGDNKRYVVTQVDAENYTATARYDSDEEMPAIDWLKPAFAPVSSDTSGGSGDRLIAIYATHTDESYVPSDGTSSEDDGGGILDVADALKSAFEKQGVTAVIDTTSHLPHDSGAYRRSRQTAVSLMKKMPDALIDVHRDGIPSAEEYLTEVEGVDTTQVRLLVGRSNQNSEANKEFAKSIKAVADEQYPGLIKDIFIGKGTYNQDLTPNAILLEFGTHTTSKERAIKATDMIATSMTSVLYGSGAADGVGSNTGSKAAVQSGNSGVGKGILFLVIFVVVAALAYAFLATGSGKGMMEKLKRNTSELTGGLLGKKPDNDRGGDES
ncbi:MAG: stage II sporulation protein P [Oscillospiraceae bacterium]|nr:stage II sporulation protein P [Oscillospiraceae bacterium]